MKNRLFRCNCSEEQLQQETAGQETKVMKNKVVYKDPNSGSGGFIRSAKLQSGQD